MTRRRIAIYLGTIGLIFLLLLIWYVWAFVLGRQTAHAKFDGQRAYSDVQTQVGFGPRIPGTEAHAKAVAWMQTQFRSAGWQVRLQQTSSMGHPIENIVASRDDLPPQLILGAHYDFADLRRSRS